ncbi:FecR family protein [Marinilabilia rubra]|uniref:Iron dicitrate transport regulator FecR n=1 Tax=Marinilabilia rubra TaxID=2162893 RepID=A0A2U2B7V3_9BACT|nr:FecR family protein [Marinilabilia rubra]PWD99124.1 iron dicitrate transport regulator FecR [Marinilabilia rubra]
MQRKESHIDKKLDENLNRLPDLNLDFEKSKDEVWAVLSKSIEASGTESSGSLVEMFPGRIWMIAAAAVIVVLGTGLFMRLYTTEVIAPLGEHVLAQLPDGSEVKLNAGSSISYKPFWWPFNRETHLEGEAFFEVKKGEEFEVNSQAGRTIVLGTSFNIYARENQYKVTCFTGKVRVVARQSGHVLEIIPNEQAALNRDGSLRLSKLKNPEEAASWLNDMFVFTGTPLNEVFDEIERQYNIAISEEADLDYLYTGNFSRNQTVEQVLKMVCKPYGLQFRNSGQEFVIVKVQK